MLAVALVGHGFAPPGPDRSEAEATLGSNESILIIEVLLGLLALIGVWSAFGRVSLHRFLSGPVVKNVFLGVRVQVPGTHGGPGGACVAHVVSIDERQAVLLSPQPLRRGDQLDLDLSGLGHGAAGLGTVTGGVAAVRVQSGVPASYLVTVRFGALPASSRATLQTYVRQLARNSQPLHA